MMDLCLTEGVVVHFVVDNGMQQGRHRGAMIRNVLDKTPGREVVDLDVFSDSARDKLPPFDQRNAIVHDEARAPGTWHFYQLEPESAYKVG